MTLKSIVAITLLALGSATAQAASHDLSFGPYAVTSDKVDSAFFIDTFNFGFAGASGMLSASAIEYGLGKYIDITWPSAKAFTVYGDWDGQGSTLLSLGDPGQKAGVFLVEDLPVPSHFSIVIQGQAIGNGASAFQLGLKGSYGLSAVAQPVPEPGTGVLLLSGLFVLAVPTVLRKRNDRSLYGRDAI